jgi:FkbM family methyltransferase
MEIKLLQALRRVSILSSVPTTVPKAASKDAAQLDHRVREVRVNIGGKNYTMTSDDDYLGHIEKGFEPDMVKLFRAVAGDSDVILDIGANIGCTALLFGELARNVYAFEPSQTTFAFLERNISMSGLKNVFPQNMGLGADPGEYPLTFASSNRSGGFVSNQTQANAGHTVEKIVIRRLDEVLKALNVSRVDFIKIDVEGFEGHVLRGATQTLATYRPVVVLELNHWCLNAFQRTSIPDFFDLLRSMFPILLAVDGLSYLNLHEKNDSYVVMYQHILHMRFPNILAAFDQSRLDKFMSLYQHQFIPYGSPGKSAPLAFPYAIMVTAETPHQIGSFDSAKQAMVTKQNEAGALVYGPYLLLEAGNYRAVFKLSVQGSCEETAGKLDVNAFSHAKPDNPVATVDLKPGADEQRVTLDFQSATGMRYEFRVWANGKGTLSVKEVVIERKG